MKRVSILVGVVTALLALGAPGVARADTVTDWNQKAFTALNVTAGRLSQMKGGPLAAAGPQSSRSQ